MAITGLTLSGMQNALKRYYIGPIRDQLNNKTVLLSRLQRDEDSVSGVVGDTLTAYVPMLYRRNQAIGARADGGVLPAAKYRRHLQATIALKYNYGRIEITGPTIAGSRSSKGAFVKAVENEIKGMVTGMKVDINRQCFGDGTGWMARVNGTSTGTTVTVDTPGTQNLEEGMAIDTYSATSSGTSGADSATIASIDSATQFTLDSATTMTDNYYIFRY